MVPVKSSDTAYEFGVAFAVELTDPVPTELTAETLKLYNEPLTKPVTVAPVEAEIPSEKVDQMVGSEASLYSTI